MPTLGENARLLLERPRRHLAKMQRRGVRRVAAEDLERTVARLRKLRWRLAHDHAPNAVPVFIVGLQRSGTSMLILRLSKSPQVQTYDESKRSPAFKDFELREDSVIRSLVEQSPHTCVVFKALCDSHRVEHLLDELGTPRKGRAIWIYRSMEGRVRSAVALFQDNNLRVLRALSAGDAAGSWQAAGLTPHLREIVGQFDYDRMTPESAAALWWYIRNSLFFDLGLHQRLDIALTSYDRFLADPDGMMRCVCSFMGISYEPAMSAGIAARPAPSAGDLDIDPTIRALCSDLEQRLDSWFEAHGAHPAAAAAA